MLHLHLSPTQISANVVQEALQCLKQALKCTLAALSHLICLLRARFMDGFYGGWHRGQVANYIGTFIGNHKQDLGSRGTEIVSKSATCSKGIMARNTAYGEVRERTCLLVWISSPFTFLSHFQLLVPNILSLAGGSF